MATPSTAPPGTRPRPRPFALPSSPSSTTGASPSSPPSPSPSHTHSSPYPSSANDDDDIDADAPLPFPTALPRADFLAPSFDAAAYLSSPSLAHRHQTLEDLRSDLRERSAAIAAELLALVNGNYTAFLGLGDELLGGGERVEDVRVALLGFRRAVEEIRGRVRERAGEVGGLSRELGGVRAEVEVGRKMVELDERVGLLEGRLAIAGEKTASLESDEESEEEDEDEQDDMPDGTLGSSPAKLARLADEYTVVEELADDIGREAPFVRKMEERMAKCRSTILLDLATALKEAKKAGVAGQARLLKLMGIYALMDAQAEAVKTLKGN
ncbi:oligomeric golgi complex component, COG2-domain-containing protein [Whalleya microplaca]|nr:oligomeric golgi complex component, COG2-domain-containing protein [Whalleya microplaca]